MKRIITLFIVLLCSSSFVSAASSNKAVFKKAGKQAKKELKALTEDGWTPLSAGDSSFMLWDHIYNVNIGTHDEVICESWGPKLNVAEYSAKQKSLYKVFDYLLENASANGTLPESRDGEYTVEDIQSCVEPSIAIFNKDAKGYICRVYILINKEKASLIKIMPKNN
ncbi:MAG: hypothetical protein J6Q12_04295 [Bacteroidales bacterium]|nr:hypothetical protein [Bacteroidales bacterium]